MYGVKITIVRPGAPVVAAEYLCEWVCKRFDIDPPIYPRRVAFYTKDRAFDASKMTRVLGFEPRIDNDQGIPDVAPWDVEREWIAHTPVMQP